MLQKISAQDFLPWVDKPCRVYAEDYSFDLTMLSVEEKTRLKRPEDTRTPFSVLLAGPLEPCFEFGTLNIEVESGLLAQGVYIQRTATPPGADPQAAYYQIIFN